MFHHVMLSPFLELGYVVQRQSWSTINPQEEFFPINHPKQGELLLCEPYQ